MPTVGRKKFSYTRKGVAEAKAEAKKTGKGISMKKGYKKGGVAKKKAGGAAKKMQRGGQAHRDWFNEQTSDWTPQQRAANQAKTAKIRRGAKAKRQLKKAPPPTRVSVRGPGMKSGGVAKKKAGGAAKKMQRGGHAPIPAHERMASGEPIQWQQGPVGERRRMDYRNFVNPGVARRQLARQEAAGGPGRRAANIGPGGWKKGGAVSNRSGFNLFGYKKGGSKKK